MERVTYHITHEQRAWLHAEAGRLGIAVPELVRRLLDKWRGAEKLAVTAAEWRSLRRVP